MGIQYRMAAVLQHAAQSIEATPPVYERHVWRSSFGDIVIEVRGHDVYVAGKKVELVPELSGPTVGSAGRDVFR